MKIRHILTKVGRTVVFSLPLTHRKKVALGNWAFSNFPVFFRGIASYQNWQAQKGIYVESVSEGCRNDTENSAKDLGVAGQLKPCIDCRQPLFDCEKDSPEYKADYVVLDDVCISADELAVKLIAFYLPQFHPFPENDEWWGRGFTEWTNVSKAVPQFVGHYQPRLPGELGFYDLRLPEVMTRQIELAKQYGVFGFCFHHYWFGGKRLLEKPVEMFLQDSTMDFPFCLCWANENWSRRWDGSEDDILIAQNHSPEDDLNFIVDLARYLKDPRYIRIDGKPLIIVYRASILPDPKKTVDCWKDYCRDKGLGEIYLVAAQSFEVTNPKVYGFDAAVEFPPHQLHPELFNAKHDVINSDYSGCVFDFEDLINHYCSREISDSYTTFKTVSPGWDNSARKPGRGHTFHNATPEKYAEWLGRACRTTIENNSASERLVFINAWNEWGEGAYLEPDRKFGYAYLSETRTTLSQLGTLDNEKEIKVTEEKIILAIHDAFQAGSQLLTLNIAKTLSQNFGYRVDLVVFGDGPLISEYKKYATVHQLSGENQTGSKAKDLAFKLYKSGASFAIANTTATGLFVETLKTTGMSVISLVHELPGIIKNYGLEGFADKISKNADSVVFAAEHVRKGFEEFVSLENVNTIIRPQGAYKISKFRGFRDKSSPRLILREKLGIDKSSQIVLGVGHGDHRKGVDLFVTIGIEVMRQNPQAHCLWLGSIHGELQNLVNLSVNESGLSHRFHFPGFDSESDLYYAGSDVYALTSREDPFPTVVLESLEVGVPVVGFEGAGGFNELLNSGYGLNCPAFDTTAFAKAVQSLLMNPLEMQNIGNKGMNLVENEFSFHKYVFDLILLLNSKLKRISVIVPNFNYARYLAQRIKSVTAQTYPIFEIIILDDSSSDNSLDVLTELKNEPGLEFRLIQNESNSGSVFCQWLKGAEMAQGDFVWIAEADDLAESGFLEEVMKPFANPQVVLSYSQSKQIDENGALLDNDYLTYTEDISTDKWLSSYTLEGKKEIETALAVKNTIPNVSAVVFRRDALVATLREKMIDIQQYKIAGDWVTYIDLLESGDIAFTQNSLNKHRRHSTSVTIGSQYRPHLKEVVSVQKMIKDKHVLPSETVDLAKKYAQVLYTQFELSCDGTTRIEDDEEFKDYVC